MSEYRRAGERTADEVLAYIAEHTQDLWTIAQESMDFEGADPEPELQGADYWELIEGFKERMREALAQQAHVALSKD